MPVHDACAALFRQSARCKDLHWETERDVFRRRGLTDEQIDRQRAQFEDYVRQPPAEVCRDVLEERIRLATECYSNDCGAFVNCMVAQRARFEITPRT